AVCIRSNSPGPWPWCRWQAASRSRRLAASEKLYRRAIQIVTERLGGEHFDTKLLESGLAAVYHSMGRNTESERLLGRSVPLLREAMAPNDPRLVSSLTLYARLLHANRRDAQAEAVEAELRAVLDPCPVSTAATPCPVSGLTK
ncbi:MAG: tetratricopeptide repeat protein, partial [bacterium]|nr:tetratricopeptide repeat protein [bacterium]